MADLSFGKADIDAGSVEGGDHCIGLAVLEDNLGLARLLKSCLVRDFPEVDPIFFESSDQALAMLKADGPIPLIWVSDLTDMPVECIAEALKATNKRVFMVLMSGHSLLELDEIRHLWESDLFEFVSLKKPFRMDGFCRLIRKAIAHILVLAEEDDEASCSADWHPPLEEEEPRFDHKIAEFGNLKDLIGVLPYHPSRVSMYPTSFDELTPLIETAFDPLKDALGGSFEDFLEQWLLLFSSDPKVDRRPALLEILQRIPGADFVLDICVHDINAILTPYFVSGKEPRGQVWEQLKVDLSKFIDRSLAPFAKYNVEKKPEAFWESQNIVSAFREWGKEGILVDSDIEGDLEIYFPAGALESVMRTFLSNFKKVRRLSKKKEARLDVYARKVGDKARFYFEDNLKPFDVRVFPDLFDSRLESEENEGMGTGLLRTHKLAKLDHVDGSIISFHLRDDVWWKKVAGFSPHQASVDEMQELEPYLKPDSTKIFMMELPIAA